MATQFHSALRRVNPEPIRRALCRWYRRQRRDLPWRRTRDPYRIWVSEIMLQQTRVEAVRDHYRRWLRAFPTVQALAHAPLHRVLKLWEGLGYYQRARNLHRAARILTRRLRQRKSSKTKGLGGTDPCYTCSVYPVRAAEWRALPGVGRYTAGAIASIAYGERVAAVDGNVARVLARLFAVHGDIKRPATERRLWALADQLVPAHNPGEFNQAMMELGALVCVPRAPRCAICPLRRLCRARRCGLAQRLPQRGPRPLLREVTATVAWVRRDGKILLRQRPAGGLLAGFWELPPAAGNGPELFRIRHSITQQRITLRVLAAPAAPANRWVCVRRLSHLPMPAAHRRAIVRLLPRR